MEKISISLKARVDYQSEEFRKNSPLFQRGREKSLTHLHAAGYVVNLEHLFAYNCQTILEASKKYASNEYLSKVFLDKYNEENGHDAWARADWVKMSKAGNVNQKPEILPEMYELTTFLHETMLKAPYSYITYMYAAEYSATVLGPEWLSHLESNLGIKSNQVTALSKHLVLDGDHAEEMADTLDTLNLSLADRQSVLTFVDELFVKYHNFFSALARIDERYFDGTRASQEISTRA